MSLAAVMRQVSISDITRDVSLLFHVAVFVIGAAPLLVYTFSRSRRMRVAVPLLYLVTPFLFATANGLKGLASCVLSMPAAPFFAITALTGRQDGEFYAEGFLVYTAIGWWMILLSFVLVSELLLSRHETRPA
jgi:hypothetical protein